MSQEMPPRSCILGNRLAQMEALHAYIEPWAAWRCAPPAASS